MIPVLTVSLDKSGKKVIADLLNAEKNIRAALAQFTRAVADSVQDDLEGATAAAADYSDLKVVYFGKIGKNEVVALVLPDSLRTLTADDEWKTAVSAVPTDSKNIDQLAMASGGPWLAEMLPDWASDSVRLVSRRISTEEADALLSKIADDPDKVDLLASWGKVKKGSNPGQVIEQVRKLMFPTGLEVQEDIAWRVLRQEFGLGGEASVPHLRKAFKDVDPGMELLRMFWRNLMGDDLEQVQEDSRLANKMKPVENFQAFVSGDKVMPT